MMSQVGQLMQMGQDAFKAGRNLVKGMGQDGKFFRDSKKGEVSELRAELANPDIDIMKDAVKKVSSAFVRQCIDACLNRLDGAEVRLPRGPVSQRCTHCCVSSQVIAAITVGKDMNALFPDVVNCMRTGKLEQWLRSGHERMSDNRLDFVCFRRYLVCMKESLTSEPFADNVEVKKLVYLYLINYAKRYVDSGSRFRSAP